ncbi:SNF2 family domain-containing protein [Hysterangium stoloniferum]|nr:SNF2 family domain-containing protein [Hysterangium stoloniferum]
MQDHAIVLYDPTIDERETDEEGKERVKEEERVNAIKEAQERNKGLFNPHKNLRSLLGERQQKNQKQSKVPVVIDPRLSKVLRPHQVEGVKVIIIVISNEAERSSGLVFVPLHNWNARGQPIWLRYTVPSLALDGKGTKAEMIERVQGWASASGRTPYLVNVEVGLLLCDEGHRLKNGDSLAFTALTSLNVKRRVILSGTPIQNFENAIIRRRDADATDKDKQKWQEKLQEMSACPLKAINLLKKLCNHPELLDLPGDLKGSDKLIPPDFSGPNDKAISRVKSTIKPFIYRVLHSIKTETKDKIVLISNYTQTLDLFERMLRSKSTYGYFRLDGGMAITKRQKYVDQFNDPERSEFVFLLSSKAGGCGINLIGANRLILFDPEKVFQRQASKQALSSCVVDDKQDAERHFSVDDLRKLFLFKEKTLCETHDTCKCKRSPALLYGDASTWNHFTNWELKNNHDDLLRAEAGLREISFVFQDISH